MHQKTRQLALTALFVALTFLLGLTPLGIIPTPLVNFTILHIPVVVGTLMLGVKSGIILGFCFGLASVLRAFGIPYPASGLVMNLMGESVLLTILMSMIPRLLVPIETMAIYRLMESEKVKPYVALPVAAVAGSLTNTVFYMGLMLVFYYVVGLESGVVFGLITGSVLLGGIVEAVVCAIVTTPVVTALRKQKK